MRITCHLPDKIGQELKRVTENEGSSVSNFIARAVERELIDQRKRFFGKKVLDAASIANVSDDALDLLEDGRNDDRS